MHVLMTAYSWAENNGGAAMIRANARALLRQGHQVSLVWTNTEPRPGRPPYYVEATVDQGMRLFGVHNRAASYYDVEHPRREVDDPQLCRLFADLIAALRPDIVHYHALITFSLGVAAAVHRAGIPSIYTAHDYWPLCPRVSLLQYDMNVCAGPSPDGGKCAACNRRFDLRSGYAERLARSIEALGTCVDRQLAVSQRLRQLFLASGYDGTRIQVLYQQTELMDRIWQQVGASRVADAPLTGPLKVGFIGRLAHHKGVHVLVDALQAFDPGQVECHVFGACFEPHYLSALRQMDGKGLVRFHGEFEPDQLPGLLQQVDVVVVPSIWEDCAPLVVAEALAARVPVIGSRIGGIPEFVIDGVTGLLCQPGSAVELALALERFRFDPALLGRMQGNIQAPRGFQSYFDELLGHYRQLCRHEIGN